MALLEQQGASFSIIEYLKTPLSASAVKQLCAVLGCRVADVIRRGEPCYKTLDIAGGAQDDDTLAVLIEQNPVLLERPIVIKGDRGVIGRPPENVMAVIA